MTFPIMNNLLATKNQWKCDNNSNRKQNQISKDTKMNRVLSYQTAMQINDDRDVRAFITKRTCVSILFSTSFIVLILGE